MTHTHAHALIHCLCIRDNHPVPNCRIMWMWVLWCIAALAAVYLWGKWLCTAVLRIWWNMPPNPSLISGALLLFERWQLTLDREMYGVGNVPPPMEGPKADAITPDNKEGRFIVNGNHRYATLMAVVKEADKFIYHNTQLTGKRRIDTWSPS
jgi:hypothetical protein